MKVLHLTHTDIEDDSRILKQIEALTSEYEVSAIGILGHEKPHNNPVKGKPIALNLISRRLTFFPKRLRHAVTFLELLTKVVWVTRSDRYGVIHCHDTMVLPIGVILKKFKGGKLVYDAHELESDRNAITPFLGKLIFLLEKLCWQSIDHLIVVSDSIATWYHNHLGEIPSEVILNSPYFNQDEVDEQQGSYLREKFSIPKSTKIFIYIGILGPGRGVEFLLDVFSESIDSAALVFLGYGELEESVKSATAASPNIFFHPPVPHSEVVKVASSADVGCCLIENVSLSDYYCLPNKLFEYLFSGLHVLGSDFPEIRRLIFEVNAGSVVPLEREAARRVVKDYAQRDISPVYHSTLKKFSWDTQAQKLKRVYLNLGG